MITDQREYNINNLVMPWWKFQLYKIKLFLQDINKRVSEVKTYKTDRYEFTTGWSGFALGYQSPDYDSTGHIQIYFIWGKLFYYPSKKIRPYIKGEDFDEPSRWGISYQSENSSIYLNWGQKYKFIDMPWSYGWVRTSHLRKDGKWEHETKGNYKDIHDKKWDGVLFEETHDYTYTLNSGKKQNVKATIKVVEREWRMRWLIWTPLKNKVHRDIDVSFSSEVGEGVTSWKGGTVGCGYKMGIDETPLQTLRRMERERKFGR